MKYVPDSTVCIRVVLSLALVVSAAGAVTTSAAAQSDQPDWAVELFEDMGPMVERYNENVNASDLGIAASQLRDENVNVILHDRANDTGATVSFRMDEQLHIQELQLGTRDDATIQMITDKATMERVIDADDPSAEFQSALSPPDRDITISGIGPIKNIKWRVINFGVDLFF